MDKVVIVGVNEYSEYVYQCILKDNAAEIIAFSSLKDFMNKNEHCGLPVYPLEELPQFLDMDECKVLLAIGYTKMNQRRENTYHLCKKLNYKIYTYISSRAYVDCKLEDIGEGCIIMPRADICPCTKIGICNVFNSGSVVGHTSVIGDFNWFSGNACTAGDVTIGSRCFFGMNTLICNGVNVGDETLLGVYSYVTSDTKPGLAYMGMPAKNKRNMKSMTVIDFV